MKKLIAAVTLAAALCAQDVHNGPLDVRGALSVGPAGSADFSASQWLRIKIGTGAPSGALCASAAHVGRMYSRSDAATVNASLYHCSQTGVGTYAWELSGAGGGGGAVASVFGLTGAVMATAAANRGLFGPTSGADAAPTLRLMTLADLPSCPTTTAGSVLYRWNGTSIICGGVAGEDVTSGVLAAARGGAGTVNGLMKANGSGVVSAAVAGADYQAPLTLTTVGASGPATLISNVLNIPQYSGGAASPPFTLTRTSSTVLTVTVVAGIESGTAACPSSTSATITTNGTSGTGAAAIYLNPNCVIGVSMAPAATCSGCTIDSATGVFPDGVFPISLSANVTSGTWDVGPTVRINPQLRQSPLAPGSGVTFTAGSGGVTLVNATGGGGATRINLSLGTCDPVTGLQMNGTWSRFTTSPATAPALACSGSPAYFPNFSYSNTDANNAAIAVFDVPGTWTSGSVNLTLRGSQDWWNGQSRWIVSSGCVASGATYTAFPTLNAGQNTTTITGVSGDQNVIKTYTLTGVTMTGCSANSRMYLRVQRDLTVTSFGDVLRMIGGYIDFN